MKKALFPISLLALVGILSACGGNAEESTTSTSNGGDTSTSSTTTSEPPAEKKLTAAYSSPAKLSYLNMRPTYNYYLTTFAFKTLELYNDGTYMLSDISSTFSGLVLPGEGNDATGSERTNYVRRFYGNFTSTVNDLDEDLNDVTLGTPNRAVVNYNSLYFVDTANWEGEVTLPDSHTNTETTFSTAGDFMASIAFDETKIQTATSTASFDYFDIEVAASYKGTLLTEAEKFDSYMSGATLSYINMRPTYNYYLTTFAFDVLDLHDDGSYLLSTYSMCFSALVLPGEGNDATGAERTNYVYHYRGTYTSKDNDLDPDSLDISISAPTGAAIYYDAAYVVDTDKWDEAAKEATGVINQATGEVISTYETGADYLASIAYEAQTVMASKVDKSIDKLEI